MLAGIACLFAFFLFTLTAFFGGDSEEDPANTKDRYFKVEQGDFAISILAQGELNAIHNHKLRFEGKGKKGLTIIQIVEDNTFVKKGDPIISFDNEAYLEEELKLKEELEDITENYERTSERLEEDYADAIELLEEKLDNAKENLKLFVENQAIDRDKQISTLTELSNKYQTARDALLKYENLEYRSTRKKHKATIDEKEQGYHDTLDKLEEARTRLSEAQLQDPATRNKRERDVSNAEKNVENSTTQWENARKTDRRFKRYDHPQKLRQLNSNTTKTQLDLRRAIVEARGKMVQAERRFRNLKREIDKAERNLTERHERYRDDKEKLESEYVKNKTRVQKRLDEYQYDIANLTLYAPVDGIVSTGEAPTRRNREPKQLNIGVSVKPNETVARIPDLSQFLVKCDIPEAYRSRLDNGQTTILRNKAIPNLLMKGQIKEIATMSRRIRHWDTFSPKVYPIEISTDSSDPRLVPGMTVEVEILVEEVKNVLYVPVESLYNKEGVAHCRVKTAFGIEEREVTVGRASSHFAEITAGLEAGDTVLLHQTTDAQKS